MKLKLESGLKEAALLRVELAESRAEVAELQVWWSVLRSNSPCFYLLLPLVWQPALWGASAFAQGPLQPFGGMHDQHRATSGGTLCGRPLKGRRKKPLLPGMTCGGCALALQVV